MAVHEKRLSRDPLESDVAEILRLLLSTTMPSGAPRFPMKRALPSRVSPGSPSSPRWAKYREDAKGDKKRCSFKGTAVSEAHPGPASLSNHGPIEFRHRQVCLDPKDSCVHRSPQGHLHLTTRKLKYEIIYLR